MVRPLQAEILDRIPALFDLFFQFVQLHPDGVQRRLGARLVDVIPT
jgi:hypothetical protein